MSMTPPFLGTLRKRAMMIFCVFGGDSMLHRVTAESQTDVAIVIYFCKLFLSNNKSE
jgi:hypothetical protein